MALRRLAKRSLIDIRVTSGDIMGNITSLEGSVCGWRQIYLRLDDVAVRSFGKATS